MDAISFVMGEKTTSLRVKRLSDLIHGASVNQPVSRTASVTAIFEMDDGTEKNFTRVVNGSSSEHYINQVCVVIQILQYYLDSNEVKWFVQLRTKLKFSP